MRIQRGNALPETMIVATFMMLMLFGTLNLAILGYNQVQADGASFIGAVSYTHLDVYKRQHRGGKNELESTAPV